MSWLASRVKTAMSVVIADPEIAAVAARRERSGIQRVREPVAAMVTRAAHTAVRSAPRASGKAACASSTLDAVLRHRLPRYQQTHPGVTVTYSAVGSGDPAEAMTALT